MGIRAQPVPDDSACEVSNTSESSLSVKSTDAFYIVNLEEDRYVYLNDAYVKLWGYNPINADSAFTSFLNSVHPDDRARLSTVLSDLTEHSLVEEYRIIHPNGTVRWIRDRIFKFVSGSGKSYQIAGFAEDITAYLNDHVALEDRLKLEQVVGYIATQFIQSQPSDFGKSIHFALAHMGEIVAADRSYLFSIDYTRQTLSNTHEWCKAGIAPQIDSLQDLPLDTFPWVLQKLAQREVVSIEQVGNLPPEAKGEREILEMQGIFSLLIVPLFATGNLIGFIGFDAVQGTRTWVAADIILLQVVAEVIASALQRLEVEVKLNENEIRLALAIEATRSGLIEYDIASGSVYLSPHFYAALGYSVESNSALSSLEDLWRYIDPRHRQLAREAFDASILQNIPLDQPVRILSASGDYSWYHIRGQPVIHPLTQRVRFVGLIDDITEIQEHAETLEAKVLERTAELNSLNAALVQANQRKDEFLANMSHELRTPLGTILNKVEMMNLGIYGVLTPKQGYSLEVIEQSAHHLLNLINDILDLSKVEAGKIELERTYVNVADICSYTTTFVQDMATKRNISISIDVEPHISAVFVDERRLVQILVNLLNNAVKFTPQGGSIGIKVTAERKTEQLTFTVWDTGVGIAQEDLERLFQPFVQLDSGLNRNVEGTGLGLALVARLTKVHGGRLNVESTPGKGSRFHVSLPWHPQ
jgi:PAS domain S-box-containing protein